MFQTIYERPVEWNADRYIRGYSHTQFTSLITEEAKEYTDAIILADKLDALADMFFVCIGGLWKLGENPYNYLYNKHPFALQYPQEGDVNTWPGIDHLVNRITILDDSEAIKTCIAALLQAINFEFLNLTCKEQEAELAIAIVCDSNDTKARITIPAGDKGDLKTKGFIPPNKRLQLLAEMIQNDEEV